MCPLLFEFPLATGTLRWKPLLPQFYRLEGLQPYGLMQNAPRKPYPKGTRSPLWRYQ